MPKKGPLPLFLFSISVQPNKKYANPSISLPTTHPSKYQDNTK